MRPNPTSAFASTPSRCAIVLAAFAAAGCVADPGDAAREANAVDPAAPENTGEVSSTLPPEGTENPRLERCLTEATGSLTDEHNTFFYHEDEAIRLRGTPAVGMFVGDNVFANHSNFVAATAQEESGLVDEMTNAYDFNGKSQLGSCDFDGDGVTDPFMATGQSWWYRSGRTGPWEFLNASTKKLFEVNIGFFDGDTGGKPAPRRLTVPGNIADQTGFSLAP